MPWPASYQQGAACRNRTEISPRQTLHISARLRGLMWLSFVWSRFKSHCNSVKGIGHLFEVRCNGFDGTSVGRGIATEPLDGNSSPAIALILRPTMSYFDRPWIDLRFQITDTGFGQYDVIIGDPSVVVKLGATTAGFFFVRSPKYSGW